MTKKNDKKSRRSRESIVNDWQPLFAAIKDVIDWALDIAVKLSRGYDDDIEAIENVRACFHAWLAGRPCDMDVNDLLVTFATILSAIEIDLGIDSVDLLAPLRALVDEPSALPRVLRLPGASWSGSTTQLIRRFPRRRNASGAFAELARLAA